LGLSDAKLKHATQQRQTTRVMLCRARGRDQPTNDHGCN
jgi:hypothetical protein